MKHMSYFILSMLFIGSIHANATQPLTYSANTYYNQAEILRNAGKFDEAIEKYKNAITVNPNHFEAHFYLANELLKIQRFDEALHHYDQSIALHTDCVSAYYNAGFTLHLLRQDDRAMSYLEKAVYYQKEHLRAHILLGNILQQKKQLDPALDHYKQALACDHTNGEALLGIARVMRDQNNTTEAINYYNKVIECNSSSIHAHFELAYLFGANHNFESALTYYNKTLALDPNCIDATINKAHTLRYMGRMHEAQNIYEQALITQPHNAHLHYGYAESLLATGNLEKGFAEFEWRWKRDADTRNFGKYLWDGSDLEGKTILLRAEYGQGDTFQFIRYAHMLKQMNAFVIVEAQHSLVTILSQCPYIDRVIPVDAPLPYFDVQLPIMSLPYMFKASIATIPQTVPYLEIDQELVAEWGSKLGDDTHFKIGICWDASPYYDSFHSYLSKKSIPVALFEPLCTIPGVSVYSLQHMNGTEQLQHLPQGMMVHNFGPEFDIEHGRFMDSAAVMQHLDLVITVDTSVAHLAGALGVKVWVLLPNVADWRWMQDREDCPWYSTMRLFRQQVPGDWELLMNHVAQEVKSLLTSMKKSSDIITAEISVGELIDKITILEIKEEEIKDTKKLHNILVELETLNKTKQEYVPWTKKMAELYQALKNVNKQLWVIEDDIRDKEFSQCFDDEFIQLARSVYVTNDLRCKIKRQINDLLGSRLVEEKSYKDYLKVVPS